MTSVVIFLFLGLDTDPTVPSVPVPDSIPDPPDLEHIARLQEVADWLVGRAAEGRRLEGMARKDLSDVIRESPASFELFRRHLDDGIERDFLHGLPYGGEIDEAAHRHRLDGLLLAALVEAESSFLPDAVSPVGAVGLAQVMPSTARWLGRSGDLTDPDRNLEAGAAYLSRLLDRFDGDIPMALAAYNAGPNAVSRHGGVPPYRETRAYVRKVLRIYADHNREVWRTTARTAATAKLFARD
ncbi:MAG: lytic transglycosylase domain-containing protein [Acidobacteriota bacterium]